MVLNLFENAIAHAEVLSQHLSCVLKRQLNASFILQGLLDLRRSPDVMAFLELVSNQVCSLCSLVLLCLLFLSDEIYGTWVVLEFSDE